MSAPKRMQLVSGGAPVAERPSSARVAALLAEARGGVRFDPRRPNYQALQAAARAPLLDEAVAEAVRGQPRVRVQRVPAVPAATVDARADEARHKRRKVLTATLFSKPVCYFPNSSTIQRFCGVWRLTINEVSILITMDLQNVNVGGICKCLH